MTTLRSRIDELRRVLEGHQEQEQEQVALGRIRKRAEELSEAAIVLSEALQNARTLRAEGVDVPLDAPSGGLIAALDATRHTTSEALLDLGGDSRPIFLKAMADYTDKAGQQVDQAWAMHKRRRPAPDIDDELFELATGKDSELRTTRERLEGDLFVLDQRVRPGPGDVEKRRRVIDELNEIAQSVAEQAPAQAVVDFVRAAGSSQGAPLSALDDPDVRAWLDEEGRSSRFRIRPRR